MYLEPGDVFIGPTATNYVTKKKISKFEKKEIMKIRNETSHAIRMVIDYLLKKLPFQNRVVEAFRVLDPNKKQTTKTLQLFDILLSAFGHFVSNPGLTRQEFLFYINETTHEQNTEERIDFFWHRATQEQSNLRNIILTVLTTELFFRTKS